MAQRKPRFEPWQRYWLPGDPPEKRRYLRRWQINGEPCAPPEASAGPKQGSEDSGPAKGGKAAQRAGNAAQGGLFDH